MTNNEQHIENLKKLKSFHIHNGNYDPDIDRAIKVLGQEPKTGHWIRWYEQKEDDWVVDNIPHCKCSECGTEYDPHSSQFIKYCNECGARMVEPQESEEV